MTLKEWSDANNVRVITLKDGCSTIPDFSYKDRQGIWLLDDYHVTSIVAGMIWLKPTRLGQGA